jgi:S1-C subfamily serine protease
MVDTSNEAGSSLLGLSNSLADAVERAGRSLVAVNARNHVPSTGIHWRQGAIVTADHTIDREEGITLTLPDGQTVPANLAGRDAGTDLAVLKLDRADLPTAEIADGDGLKVGHIVLAVARPGQAGLSASMGAISAVSGPWRTWSGGQIDQLVRPDLTLYPGFSGGPLVDAQGRVAGVNTSGLSRSMTLTIPASTVNRVVEQLLTRGRIARGYLGLGMQQVRLPDNLKNSLNLSSNAGLIVVSVEQGGPAEQAGVLVGDVVIALAEKPVATTDDVQGILGPDWVGKSIPVRVVRGGSPTELQLTVGERPSRGA